MKIKNIITAGVFVLATMSCTDLSETLYTQVKSADYGKSASEIETIVGRAYASLRGFRDATSISYPASEYVFFLTELTSDEACVPTRGSDWDDGGRYRQLQYHNWTPDNPVLLSAWRYCFGGISSVNAVIYQVNKSELTQEAKDKVNAECRAIRAYYYYLLLDWFGNVPIITSFDDLELPSSSTRQQVYAFIESELNTIMPLLPSTVIYGRFSQNVAHMLLARLYLNSEVFIGQARWGECIAECDKVSGYTLESNFFTSFLTENQLSSEIVFAIPYDNSAGTLGNYFATCAFHYMQGLAFTTSGTYPVCNNGMCAKPGLYSSYDENDARRDGYLVGDQIDLATGNVIIMTATGNPLSYTEEIVNYENALQNEGIRPKKYEVKGDETYERDHDLVVMRYSEILLMKAECYVRMGSPALARPLIAQVRSRVNLETPATITLKDIDNELKWEFAFEGHRRTDNIRMGDFFKPQWNITESTPLDHGIFPIPDVAMQLNSKLVQNPGY